MVPISRIERLSTIRCAALAALALSLNPWSMAATTEARTHIDAPLTAELCQEIECPITDLGSSAAESGLQAVAIAKARVSYGNQGGYAVVAPGNGQASAFAESYWIDRFVMPDLAAQVTVHLEGTLYRNTEPGGRGGNAFYRLFASREPMACDFEAASCSGHEYILLDEDGIQGSFDKKIDLPFWYGQPFYLASYLGAETRGPGMADFYGSAHLAVTAADGRALVGESGTVYGAVADVPEPSSMLLLVLGLGGLALRVGGRHRAGEAA